MQLTCTARTAGTWKGIADCGFRIAEWEEERRDRGTGTGDQDGNCQNGRDGDGEGSRDGGTKGRRPRLVTAKAQRRDQGPGTRTAQSDAQQRLAVRRGGRVLLGAANDNNGGDRGAATGNRGGARITFMTV